MAAPLQSALDLVLTGQLPPARMMVKAHLRAHARDLDGLRLLAIIEFLANAPKAGTTHMRKAIALAPQRADLRYELGTFLAGANNHADAIKEFQEALRLAPDMAPAHLELGRALMALGRIEKAIEALRKALDHAPDLSDAWQSLAAAHQHQKKWDEALAALRRGFDLGPANALIVADLVAALRADGRDSDADALIECACAADPSGEVTSALASRELSRSGGLDMTEALWTAHRKAPEDPDILCTLAESLDRQGKLGSLIPQLASCAQANPNHSTVLEWTGISLLVQEQMGQATENILLLAADLAAQEKRLSRAPNALGHLYFNRGDLPNAVKWFRKVLDLDPANAGIHSNLLFALRHGGDMSAEELFAEHKRFGEIQESLVRPLPLPPVSPADADRRLRIGFVSPDFREHAVTMFFEPYLDHLDRGQFEVFLYYSRGMVDPVTERLRTKADHFRQINNWTPADQAALIQRDQIDILVDLAGHTGFNCLPAFAMKPAPVQVSMIGYPGTTGLTRMDYRLTDQGSDPSSTAPALHVEKLLYTPGTTFRPPTDCPPVTPPPVLETGSITFGSFNRPSKISDDCFRLWTDILARTPGSRLLMVAAAREIETLREHTHKRLTAAGLDPARVVFQSRLPLADFMALLSTVDIGLDPFPYGGGTTSLLTLWMGVPFVALAGTDGASRGGQETLGAVRAPELVGKTMADYAEIAVRLASDLPRLTMLRSELRARVMLSPGLQEADGARCFGDALRKVWREHVESAQRQGASALQTV